MNPLFPASLLACVGFVFSPVTAKSLSFDFTYLFQDGAKVLGRVEADWGVDYLQNIRDASWVYCDATGTPVHYGYADPGLLDIVGPQRIPSRGGVDGLQVCFLTDTNGWYDLYFAISPDAASVAFAVYSDSNPTEWTQFEKHEYGHGGWVLSRPAGAPERGSLLGMLTAGLSFAAFCRTRMDRAARDRPQSGLLS